MPDLSQIFMVAKPPTSFQSQLNRIPQGPRQIRPQSRDLFGARTYAAQKAARQSELSKQSLTNGLKHSQKQQSKIRLQISQMKQQIMYYNNLANKQMIKKSIIIILPILLFGILGVLKAKISYQLILLGMALIIKESRLNENPTLKSFLNILPPLSYLAVVYDILNEGDFLKQYVGRYQITLANLPVLLIAMCATINFLFMKKMAFISQKNIRNTQILVNNQQTIKYFFIKYLYRIKNNIQILVEILILNLFIVLLITLACLINSSMKIYESFCYTIPAGIVIYQLVDLFVYFVQFINQELLFFNLKKIFHQAQLSVAFLRLKSSSNYKVYQNGQQADDQEIVLNEQLSKIQRRCLQQIAKQLKSNAYFLNASVNYNYAINNYRDIFQIYAAQELTTLLSEINDIQLLLNKNIKTLKSTKTWKQDLFIGIRRLFAIIQNDCLRLNLLSLIQKRKILFLIMIKLSTDSHLKNKLISTLNQIIYTVKKIDNSKCSSRRFLAKLSDWVVQLQDIYQVLADGPNRIKQSINNDDYINYSRYSPEDRGEKKIVESKIYESNRL